MGNTGSGLTEAQIRALREGQTEAAEAAGVPDVPIDVTEAKATKAKKDKPKKEASATTPKERTPKQCECGCGGETKGGRFIPGHDARLHSRWNAQAKALGFANWKEGQAAGIAYDTPEVIAKAEAAAKAAAEAKAIKPEAAPAE